MTPRLGLALLLGLLVLPPPAYGGPPGVVEAGEPPSASADCGISALYTLSRLSGRPVELADIRSRLPATRPGNYSMEELSDAARQLGFRLRGVLLDRKEGGAVDRPMLAYLNRGDHGHFLVVRPIGHSGKLVQLIDSVNPPEVLDKTTLLADASWTGLALMPDDPRWGTTAVRVATGLAVIASIAWPLARRARTVMARHSPPDLDPAAGRVQART